MTGLMRRLIRVVAWLYPAGPNRVTILLLGLGAGLLLGLIAALLLKARKTRLVG
jgi:uncharacterized protein involved in exopolysaccharide biosynthesis